VSDDSGARGDGVGPGYGFRLGRRRADRLLAMLCTNDTSCSAIILSMTACRRRHIGWVSVVVVTLFLSACGSSTRTAGTPMSPAALPSCALAYDERSVANCKHLALTKGDSGAAMAVAGYYDHPFRGDHEAALSWYTKAAELGNTRVLRKLFDAYYFGFSAPKNSAKADEYLAKGAEAGQAWAQFIIAKRLETSEPEKAFTIYLHRAQAGDCYAQAKVSQAYFDGDLTTRSLTHAYFWLLLSSVDSFARKFEGHTLYAGSSALGESLCISVKRPHPSQLERALPPDLVRVTQDTATAWRRGAAEPPLPTFAGAVAADTPKPTPAAPAPSSPPRVATRPSEGQIVPRPHWIPLPVATMLPPTSGSRDLATLFATVSRSVWLVFAARSAADLEAGTGVAVGSAVAVSPRTLLTNCHVVSGRPLVWIKQGETVVESTVVQGDSETDRCILSAPQATLQPVPGMRRYTDLKVGESVYTIGSPRGLERSLGHGIISGLRQPERHLLIQTTAQISPGSSGGGLFDQFGNLLGITTFRLKDSEGLNFAIAVDEYFRP